MNGNDLLMEYGAPILVTGAGGFIGRRVAGNLLEHGFTNIRCLARPSPTPNRMPAVLGIPPDDPRVKVVEGNLLSREDCFKICQDIQIIYHLAAGRGEKSYASAYLNSVVTTRNLLEACLQHGRLKRLVNVSSFTVYTNRNKPRRGVLDETCPMETHPERRGDPYCFAKVKQEQMIREYAAKQPLPYVMMRPGVVYGPGNEQIHGRVGINPFGVFLHFGGSNQVPLTYVENCAEAIALAGMVRGIEGEAFNVVDDDLPTSRRFLRLYKRNVGPFPSVYLPRLLSYAFCSLWEKYSAWSQGQLPNVFNRKDWQATWKKTRYTNEKIKQRLGWRQKVPTPDGLGRYFESCREKMSHA